jgi:hypothetical protein
VPVISKVAKSDSGVASPAFLSFMKSESTNRKPLLAGAIAVALLASIAVIGVPAGWYSRAKISAVAAPAPAPSPVETQAVATATPEPVASESPSSNAQPEDAAALAARRQREKDRLKAREEKAALNAAAGSVPAVNPGAGPGSKRVAVTVTYDESGRVVQASGGDASALRIARQKRFPPGKAGSATVTIPIN